MTTLPNIFPALDSATEAALKESIQRFGVLVPVVKDQHGRVLDGNHRSRIADDLDTAYRVDVVDVVDDDEARAIATTLNADRRQLAPEQRREIVAALRATGHSLRAIAGAVGVAPNTVKADLEGVQSCTPDHITGQDGKTYPATRREPEPPPATAPDAVLTTRERNLAEANKRRIESVVGTCQAFERGLGDLRVDSALRVSSDEERSGWSRCIKTGERALRDLRQRVEEGASS